MRTQLQLILSTAALTALIWIYADQASQETYDSWLAVELAAPPDYLARTREQAHAKQPNVVDVQIKLRGTKAAIRRFKYGAGSRVEGTPRVVVQLKKEDLARPDPRPLPIREQLYAFAEEHGLHLADSDVWQVDYMVDRYVSHDLEVVADVGPALAGSLEGGKPEVDPKTVSMRVLESEYKKLDLPSNSVEISIAEELQTREQRGESEAEFPWPLPSRWEGIAAQFDPPRVTVRVRFERRTEPVELRIPLSVTLGQGLLGTAYEIQLQSPGEWMQSARFLVPVSLRASLKPEHVTAFIHITKEDVALSPAEPETDPSSAGWAEAEVQFALARGFEGVTPAEEPRKIFFRLLPKESKVEAGVRPG